MVKVTMRPERLMYPRPTLLVGANVDGKANFMAVGGGGVANGEPPMISVPIRHQRYTLKGILQNLTFSYVWGSLLPVMLRFPYLREPS